MSNVINWYQKAAAAGNPKAMCALGRAYAKGQGIPINTQKAIDWYEKAVTNGDITAAYYLGRLHLNMGNSKEGFDWIATAATADFEPAYFQLGHMYYTGNGVKKDEQEAIKWYEKSAAKGNQNAMYNLGVIASSKNDQEKRVHIRMPKKVKWTAAVIVSLLLVCALPLWINGCKATPQTPPDSIIAPGGSDSTLNHAGIATTQMAANLDQAHIRAEENSTNMERTAAGLQQQVTKGRALTPPTLKTDFEPVWGGIGLGIERLWYIKGINDRISEQMRMLKQQSDILTGQLIIAETENAELKTFWEGKDKEYKTTITNKDEEIGQLTSKLKDQIRSKMSWLIIASIAGIGIFIVIGFLVNDKIGKAGVFGFGVILIISIIISEFTVFMNDIRWMFPWMVGTIFVLAVAYGVWRVIENRIAIKELVQTVETAKQLLPVDKRLKYFGYHAELGILERDMHPCTKRIVVQIRKVVKKAKPIDPDEEPVPSDNVVITDPSTTIE